MVGLSDFFNGGATGAGSSYSPDLSAGPSASGPATNAPVTINPTALNLGSVLQPYQYPSNQGGAGLNVTSPFGGGASVSGSSFGVSNNVLIIGAAVLGIITIILIR